jgi:hypothetical protein
MAEMQFSQDRDSAHIAKDNWKALRQSEFDLSSCLCRLARFRQQADI